ncbi:MAG TPA: DNA-binding protein [Pseudomonas sp.]|jgi:uncharacterized OB-fold protein|nr:DNA-binding protein [Pseudomonas sp.]
MNDENGDTYLPFGLPSPVPEQDGLSSPFWEGLRQSRLLIQRCNHCNTWQHPAEWICHACHAFELSWEEVEPHGVIYSWARVWHPAHPVIVGATPYLVALVELPQACNVRLVGNLLGPATQPVIIGSTVQGVFECHADAQTPYGLLQWSAAK